MKGVILLNGEPYNNEIPCGEDTIVFCCDGAYDWANGRIKIDVLLGDFDSITSKPDNIKTERFPAEKNFTDGEIALDEMLSLLVESIDIYGGGGKRDDHFLGNIQLLYRSYKSKVPCIMHTNSCNIQLHSGKIEFINEKNTVLSLLPFFESAHIMDSEGLKYPLKNLTLKAGECRGLSNVVIGNYAYVDCTNGLLLVFKVL